VYAPASSHAQIGLVRGEIDDVPAAPVLAHPRARLGGGGGGDDFRDGDLGGLERGGLAIAAQVEFESKV